MKYLIKFVIPFIITVPVFSKNILEDLQNKWIENRDCAELINQCSCAIEEDKNAIQPWVASAYVAYLLENNPKKALDLINQAKLNLEKKEGTSSLLMKDMEQLVSFFSEKYTSTKGKIQKLLTQEEILLWEQGKHPKQIDFYKKHNPSQIEFILFESPFSSSIQKFSEI